MGWDQKFREERTLLFPNIGKNTLPPYLQENIQAAMSIQSYGKEILADIYWKMMTEYIHNALISELVKKKATTKVEFMKQYNLTKFCDTTALKWMHVLVFWYEIYKKNYYVDSHESYGTVR